MLRSKALTLSMALAGTLILWPAAAQAQHRGIYRGGWHGSVVVGTYYRPWVGYYSPWLWYDPFWGYPFGWPYPYAYAYPAPADHLASVRLQVEPTNAEVFVDGYLAGKVDDFDGTFQRLRLEPGEHEITLYAEGRRTVTQKLLLQPGGTFRIRYTMEPLGPGEAQEPRPVPRAEPRPTPDYDALGRPIERANPRPPAPQPAPQPAAEGFGTLAVRVRPPRAEILIDGERWDRSDTEQRLELQLASGTHSVEVRLDGYRPYRSDVQVKPGETVSLNVSLSRE